MPTTLDSKQETCAIVANRIRRHAILSTSAAGSGHPTSSMSCAEILATLFVHTMRLDRQHPHNPHNDKFILSKGHAAPALWAIHVEAGLVDAELLDEDLRKFGSPLEGHPTPRQPWVKAATGSLGQGLSAGLGMAWADRYDGRDARTYVLLGDGELAEGNVWEAAQIASHYHVGNLTAIVDVNRLGQTGPTMVEHDLPVYESRFQAFGWDTISVDGHDVEALMKAFDLTTQPRERPMVILARALKGKGLEETEDAEGKHGKPVSDRDASLAELPEDRELPVPFELQAPAISMEGSAEPVLVQQPIAEPDYEQKTPTRDAYGEALRKLGGECEAVIALDGEVQNSTRAKAFAGEYPDRFIQCYIAEQNMVSMALGLSKTGKLPFVSSFGAFLTRAHDQIRMAAISQANIKFAGSHAGVSIGEDGPSQMALEDLAMFRALPESTVFSPADAVSTEACVQLAAATPGIIYLRLNRSGTPVLYDGDETFTVGGSHLLRRSTDDQATIVASGMTVPLALEAAKALDEERIPVRVIDCYSIKPIDGATLRAAVAETGKIVVVEDHYAEGGLGDAVASELAGLGHAYAHLAIRGVPRSGSPESLQAYFGIDAASIANEIRRMTGR